MTIFTPINATRENPLIKDKSSLSTKNNSQHENIGDIHGTSDTSLKPVKDSVFSNGITENSVDTLRGKKRDGEVKE